MRPAARLPAGILREASRVPLPPGLRGPGTGNERTPLLCPPIAWLSAHYTDYTLSCLGGLESGCTGHESDAKFDEVNFPEPEKYPKFVPTKKGGKNCETKKS